MKLHKIILAALCCSMLAVPCMANDLDIQESITETFEFTTNPNITTQYITDASEIQEYCAENNMEYSPKLEELIIVTDNALIQAREDAMETDDRQPRLVTSIYIKNEGHSYFYTSHDPADCLFARDYPGGKVIIKDSYATQRKITGNFTAKQKDVIEASIGFEDGEDAEIAVEWTSPKVYDHNISVQIYPKYTCYPGELWAGVLWGTDYKIDSYVAMDPIGYAVGVFSN